MARQRQADFTTISSVSLFEILPNLKGSRYLLFSTHPMLEVEDNFSSNGSSYLTFYAFGSDLSFPIQANGYSADQVNKVIQLLEEEATQPNLYSLDNTLLEQSKEAGKIISEWLKKSRILPKLGQQKYFLPIPVALVMIMSSEI